jgi:hypothetical protein
MQTPPDPPLWSKQGVIAALPFAFIGVAMGLLPIRCWDYWWHVAMGAILHATHRVPDSALVLYTMPADAPSFVQPWLAQWLLYQSQTHVGELGALIARNLLTAGAFGGISLVAWRRSGSALIAATLTIIAATLANPFIDARTHLLAWPLLFPTLALAYAARRQRVAMRWAALGLPLITALWANLHGTFIFPALIAAAALAACITDRWRAPERRSAKTCAAWAATIAACLLAACLNPRGPAIYAYMFTLSAHPLIRDTVSEWFPTTLTFPAILGPGFYLLLAATAALGWRRRAALDVMDLCLLAGFALLAARQCRELMWFAMVYPIAAAPCFTGLTPPPAPDAPRRRYKLALAAILAAPLLAQPWLPPIRPLIAALDLPEPARVLTPLQGTILRATPVEAADILATRDRATLRIFNDQSYSGYLLYRLQDPAHPTQLVFTDHRYELPPLSVWLEYDAISRAEGWQDAFARHHINAVIASTRDQLPLLLAMRRDPAWREALTTPDHALFLPR